MTPGVILQSGVEAEAAVVVARTLAYGLVSLSALVLVYYMLVYSRSILVEEYRDRWWYLVVGVAAVAVYGTSGVLEVVLDTPGAVTFRLGATLFVFLFSAVGVRALYMTVRLDQGRGTGTAIPGWSWYLIIGVFILAWWGAYLLATEDIVGIVETVGLTGAVIYTLWFAVLTVRDAEGTSISAVIRHFTPALLSFAAVVVASQAARYGMVNTGPAIGVELVAIVLVGAFLFTTAVSIHHRREEVHRMFDRTTWQQQELE